MHKHRNLIIFLVLVLIRSAFIGMVKFFLWSYLQDCKTLEQIAGFLSLGGVISYLVGGAIAYAFTKKKILIASAVIISLSLLLGYFVDYKPFVLFATLISVIGFIYSLRLVVKSITVTTEILNSGFSETMINGATNIAILTGFIGGSYWGFTSYARWGEIGFWIIVGMLVLSSVLVLFLTYDKDFVGTPLLPKIKKSIPNILYITEKYFWLLVPIGLLWAVSTAITQKMLEIGIDTFNKVPKSSVTVLIVCFLGAISGHIISAFIKSKKKLVAMIFLLIFGLSVILFPHFLHIRDNYLFLKWYSFFLGIFFGIAVNILEGRYFHHIGDDRKKEYGSAAYGLITGIIMFFIMIIVHLLTKGIGTKSAFFFCGIVVLINMFFMGHLDEHE